MEMKGADFPEAKDKTLWFLTLFMGLFIAGVLPDDSFSKGNAITLCALIIIMGNFFGSVLFYLFKYKGKSLHFHQKSEAKLKQEEIENLKLKEN